MGNLKPSRLILSFTCKVHIIQDIQFKCRSVNYIYYANSIYKFAVWCTDIQ